jgi:hypothetical protein
MPCLRLCGFLPEVELTPQLSWLCGKPPNASSWLPFGNHASDAGGGREGEDGGEQDAGVDTFNFVKLGFDETDGEQRGGDTDGEADADSRLPKTD